MENQIEIWKAIEAFEDYQISSFGRFRSLKKNDYKILSLSNDNR